MGSDIEGNPNYLAQLNLGSPFLSLNSSLNSSCRELLLDPSVVEKFRYFCDGLLVFLIGLIGIIGNVIAVLVLLRPKLRDCFHQLLIALAFFDTLYIVCGGINYTVRAFEVRLDVYTITFPHFFYPFANIGMCGTIFMTVAISLERFLGICHPLHFPPQNRKSWFYIVPVLILSIMVNLTKFFESEVVWFSDFKAIERLRKESPNITFEDIPIWVPQLKRTPLRADKNYIKFYILYFRMFVIGIIPLITIIFLNIRIMYDLKTAKVQRFGSKRRLRKELNLFIIVLVIVVTFLCCHIPRILVDIYEFSHLEDIVTCNDRKKYNPYLSYLPPTWVDCISFAGHSMSILNSSVNFIIYSFVGHNFRREFFKMLGLQHCHFTCGRRGSHESTNGTWFDSCHQNPATVHPKNQQILAVITELTDIEEKQKMLEIT